MSDPDLLLITEQPSTRAYLRSMWNRRRLSTALPIEELRTEHKTTVLGNLWHLVNPLLSVLVYYFVFGTLLNADRGVDNFILWLAVGIFTYSMTASSITGGAKAIDKNRGLMRSLRFPRALIPVSVIFSNLLTFVFELLILGVVAFTTGEPPSLRWLVLPAVVLVHTCFNLGGAFLAARLNDSFRDIQQILPFLFQLFRYVSGVMFPLEVFLSESNTPGVLRVLIDANPLRLMLQSYRWVFMGTPVDVPYLVLAGGISVGLLIVGFIVFRQGEQRYGLR